MDIQRLQALFKYNRDTGHLEWAQDCGTARMGQRAGTRKASGYRAVQIDGREVVEHRVIWALVYGGVPAPGLQIDHINLVKDDNRLSNLRLATRSQQQANTRLQSNNRHGSKGIKWRADRKKWRVEIYVNGRAITVGHFNSKDDAAEAYKAAAVQHFGEFARAG